MHDESIKLEEWLSEPTHEDATNMMQAKAVVAFGTALWPL